MAGKRYGPMNSVPLSEVPAVRDNPDLGIQWLMADGVETQEEANRMAEVFVKGLRGIKEEFESFS
tara:strand:- start:3245 stop:3439 length:195 start_codon:yes stop_codon:yes gene_type:complete